MSDLFSHAEAFEPGEIAGNVRLGKFEAHYEELFAEALADGVITSEERARLERAADSFGLEQSRVFALEKALTAAWEGHNQVVVREAEVGPAASLKPLELESDPHLIALRKQISELESEVARLKDELDLARTHVAVEVDFSDFQADAEDVESIVRNLRRDPRNPSLLHALFRATRELDPDLAGRTGHILDTLGHATVEERALGQKVNPEGLCHPTASVTPEAWRRNLFHPDEEVLTGDIFAVITSAVLLGRVTALRHGGALPRLDPTKLVDPKTSTVQAVRCVAWAASILGMAPPGLLVDPTESGTMTVIPGVPPVSRLGKAALSGRSPSELAFLAGRHIASYREDHFVRVLFPTLLELEDLFLAALTLGHPQLPLGESVKKRALPIARAIEPLLEPHQIDRLRGHFLRFVEEGGRTNLQRWSAAATRTALRAGLLIGGDLGAARRMMELENEPELESKMDDLILFYTSDRCGRLRKQIGIALVT